MYADNTTIWPGRANCCEIQQTLNGSLRETNQKVFKSRRSETKKKSPYDDREVNNQTLLNQVKALYVRCRVLK